MTGTHVHEPSSCENYAEDYADSLGVGDGVGSSDKLHLGSDSCSVNRAIASDSCWAGSASDSVSNSSSSTSLNGAGMTEISRGYLLAVKLWHEAVATFAAASGGGAHLQK